MCFCMICARPKVLVLFGCWHTDQIICFHVQAMPRSMSDILCTPGWRPPVSATRCPVLSTGVGRSFPEQATFAFRLEVLTRLPFWRELAWEMTVRSSHTARLENLPPTGS